MSQIKKNVAANYAGSFWNTLMSLIFIPLYIKFMGIEAYGLVGMFSSMMVVLGLLDLGLGMALNRSLASAVASRTPPQEVRDLVRTVEVLYWAVAGLVLVSMASMAYPVAYYWVKPATLTRSEVMVAALVFAIVLSLRWPFSLYLAGLNGLQQQVMVNVLNIVAGTLRGGGAVMVLWLISPTIHAFLIWQAIISLAETISCAVILWLSLPRSIEKPKFRKAYLKTVAGYATGMFGILFVSALLGQADKLALSKMVSLEFLGYYTLAYTAASGVTRLVVPLTTALFPQFTELLTQGDYDGLRRLYGNASQTMSAVIVPTGSVLAGFSYEILNIWTGSLRLSENSATVLTLLTILMVCDGLKGVAFSLLYAKGWLRLIFWFFVFVAPITVPTLIWFIQKWGTVGAAASGLIVAAGYVLIIIPIVHKRLLGGGFWDWIWNNVVRCAVAAVAVVGLGHLLPYEGYSVPIKILFLATLWSIAFLACALALPYPRSHIVRVARAAIGRRAITDPTLM